MDFSVKELMEKRLMRLVNMSNKAEERIKELPEGRIKMRRYKDKKYYYQYVSAKNVKYISKKNNTNSIRSNPI